MTWENTKRARRLANRRRDYHQDRIAAADTTKKKLSAACGWLISEAWEAGRTTDVHEWVLAKVQEIRKEANDHDDHAE